MRNLWIVAFVATQIIACNSPRRESIRQVQQLAHQLDSVSAVYNTTDWVHYNAIVDSIKSDMAFLNKFQEQVIKLDPDFVNYAGPYSAAEKTIERLGKKSRSPIEKELAFSKAQLENLLYDIKKKAISNPDTLNLYIGQEQQALNKLINQVSDLNKTLAMQEEAYNLLQNKVAELLVKIDTSLTK